MFHFDEKRFFRGECEHPGHFPHEKPRYTMTEEIEHTAAHMRETIDRLLKFEERCKVEFDRLSQNLSSDNVIFKTTMREAWTTFISEVKNEINVFEGNVDATVSLFQKNTESNYATLSEEVREQLRVGLLEFDQKVVAFETAYVNAFDAFKEAFNKRVENYNANHLQSFAEYQINVNKIVSDFENEIRTTVTDCRREMSDAVMYMKANLNASLEDLLYTMHGEGTLTGVIDSTIVANVRQKGAVGDGVADDTAVIQNVITNNRNVLIDGGTFLVSGSIVVPSDTVVTIRNAKILSNSSTNKETIFKLTNVENVRIYGENATLEMAKPATAQQACIQIADSQNIIIDGLTLAKAGGDGLLIGGSASDIVRDVEISNCVIDNNRRNGVSFIGGINGLNLHDCVIKNTSGAEPQVGIDFEPWDISLFNENIQVYSCRFEGNANGALTVFENTRHVNIFNNWFDGNVSVKVNNDYTDNAAACPTDITFYGNTFMSTLYFYRILHGAWVVRGNTFNGGQLYVEHTVNVHADKAKEAAAKLIANNLFNGSKVPISIGNNANILIADNVANDCNVFFDAYGFFNSVVKNNFVNGYNVKLDASYVIHFNGIVDNVKVEGNVVQQNADANIVSTVVHFQGGSATNCVVENNNFAGAVFGKAVTFNAQADNLARNNKTPVYAGIAESLPVASAKFVGVIVTYLRENQPVVMVCKPSETGFEWSEI